ncbi:MAG: glycosyltransferase [Clostridia bacterium]|nr:glycosyltransferase [Clostridia bacterium]
MANKTKPLVSIVIAYYNQGEYLEEAVSSAINQTYTNIEIVLVNDGSDDSHSIEVLNKLKKLYKKKIIFIDQKNGKLPNARNTGIKISKGEFVCCLDSDDILEPEYVQTVIEPLIKDKSLGFCSSWSRLFGFQEGIRKNLPINIKTCLAENTNVSSALFRKKCWQEVGGYDENMIHGYEDWDFWVSIAEKGYFSTVIKKPFFNYRIKESSMITESNKWRLENMNYMYKKHLNILKKYGSENALYIERQLIETQKDQIAKQEHILELTSRLVSETNDLNSKIFKLQSENQNLSKQINEINKVVSNYESENQNLSKQINEINKVVSNYESENQNLTKQIEEVNQKISIHQNNLNVLTSSKYYKIWRLYCKFKDTIKI